MSNKKIVKIKKNAEKNEVHVPLLVKKNTNNKRIKNKQEETTPKEITVSNAKLNSAILICIISILLFITSYIIIKKATTNNTSVVAKEEIKEDNDESIFKEWTTLDDNVFVFEKDGNFYWYEDKTNLDDNYYGGTYTYLKGEDALREMGYDEKEFKKVFGEKIEEDNVYSLELTPTIAFMAGTDKTETYLPNNITWWYILIIKNDGSAIAYNKTLDIRYHLK